MERITSEQNKWLKKIKALGLKKYRDEYGQFVIEGGRFCEEALKNKAEIEALLVSEAALENPAVKGVLTKFTPDYFVVAGNLLEKCLPTVHPQGIAAIVAKPSWDLEQVLQIDVVLIIDGIQDPGNLGTLIRTSLGVGVGAVFCLKGTVDLYNEKTLRATMGAVFNLPVLYIQDKQSLLNLLQKHNFTVVVADVNTEMYYYEYNYPEKVALVLGSEAHGPLNFQESYQKVKIPLNPVVESLNVAIAGGIILYEIFRQKHFSLD